LDLINACKLLDLPVANTQTGKITVLENGLNFDLFEVKRVFYLYDIPAGQKRGAHAHKKTHQLIIAAFGSFRVRLFDGNNECIVNLNKPFEGLYIPPLMWASQEDFSGGAICLVCASHEYDESDYIRNRAEYINFINQGA
jgi:hypothetical protein